MDLLVTVLSGFALALLAPTVVRRARGKAGWLLALLPAGLTMYFARLLGPVAAGRKFVEFVP